MLAALAAAGARAGATRGPQGGRARRPPLPHRRDAARRSIPQAAVRLHAEGAHGAGRSRTRPELRNAIREELNTRELSGARSEEGEPRQERRHQAADGPRRADRAGPRLRDRLDQEEPDSRSRRCGRNTTQIKAQMGDKEYKVKHILVEKEDEAKDVIAQLQKGGKFDELAKARSKDPGSKDRGGDLDWNAPGGFVKPFGDAMIAHAEGQVHGHAGADAVRLPRDPGRGRPRREGASVRGSEAATAATPAGCVPRQVLQGTAREGRRVNSGVRATARKGRPVRPALFLARSASSPRSSRSAGQNGGEPHTLRSSHAPGQQRTCTQLTRSSSMNFDWHFALRLPPATDLRAQRGRDVATARHAGGHRDARARAATRSTPRSPPRSRLPLVEPCSNGLGIRSLRDPVDRQRAGRA